MQRSLQQPEAHKHNINTVEPYSIKGDDLINRYTPAVTIVKQQ